MKRTCLLAVAGLLIAGAVRPQEVESKPGSRPVDAREAGLERLRKHFGPPPPAPPPPKPDSGPVPGLAAEMTANLETARLEALKAYDAAISPVMRGLGRIGPSTDPKLLRTLADAIAESDALVLKVESPAFEARCPERDLIGRSERPLWGRSVGIELDPSPRSMVITGIPVQGKKITGVASALPSKLAPWHDVAFDLEFTLLAGELEMYVRYWPDRKSYMVRFGPSDGYELNKPNLMTVRVQGSQISLQQPDQPENRDRFAIDTSRDGGIGFGLRNGSKVEIRRLNLKVLR